MGGGYMRSRCTCNLLDKQIVEDGDIFDGDANDG